MSTGFFLSALVCLVYRGEGNNPLVPFDSSATMQAKATHSPGRCSSEESRWTAPKNKGKIRFFYQPVAGSTLV